nr:pilin [Pseudomonas sp. RW407]
MTEGLNLASAAKLALSETYTANAGIAINAYAGVGPAAAAGPNTVNTGFEFAATRDVATIAIAAVPGGGGAIAVGAGAITITYSASISAPTAPLTLTLTPGSGAIAAGVPAAGITPGLPIVWGCAVNNVNNNDLVPVNCRI